MTSLRKQKRPAFVLPSYSWHSQMSLLLKSGGGKKPKLEGYQGKI